MVATIAELQHKLDGLRMVEAAAAGLKATREASEAREAAAASQFVVLDTGEFEAYQACDMCGE